MCRLDYDDLSYIHEYLFGYQAKEPTIGGPDTAIMLWKPNKSLFQGSTSVGIHVQKNLFTVCFLDFVTVFLTWPIVSAKLTAVF